MWVSLAGLGEFRCGGIISESDDGANTSVAIRGRRRYRAVRPRFKDIVSNIAKTVNLNRAFTAPVSFKFWFYPHIAGSVSNHNVAYRCSVADSVAEYNRRVPRAGLEPARRKTASGFQDHCVCHFRHLGTAAQRRGYCLVGWPRRDLYLQREFFKRLIKRLDEGQHSI